MNRTSRALILIALIILVAPPLVRAQATLQTVPDPVFVGAGDIARCDLPDDELTALLLDNIEGTVFTAGDNAYLSGTLKDYQQCYEPSWGRHRARTRPAPGNHEYVSLNAAPYFAYYGENAGPKGRGYYSFNLGSWHIISLNSNIAADANSAQVQWLAADLASNPAACTLAYWHHPLFSSGPHGDDPMMKTVWDVLYQASADVVIVGHDHDYERFAQQTPDGVADPGRGIREFVVGTGGAPLTGFNPIPDANSEVRESATWGVLKLTLHPTSFDWQFIPIAGQTFTDSGSGTCV